MHYLSDFCCPLGGRAGGKPHVLRHETEVFLSTGREFVYVYDQEGGMLTVSGGREGRQAGGRRPSEVSRGRACPRLTSLSRRPGGVPVSRPSVAPAAPGHPQGALRPVRPDWHLLSVAGLAEQVRGRGPHSSGRSHVGWTGTRSLCGCDPRVPASEKFLAVETQVVPPAARNTTALALGCLGRPQSGSQKEVSPVGGDSKGWLAIGLCWENSNTQPRCNTGITPSDERCLWSHVVRVTCRMACGWMPVMSSA